MMPQLVTANLVCVTHMPLLQGVRVERYSLLRAVDPRPALPEWLPYSPGLLSDMLRQRLGEEGQSVKRIHAPKSS